MFKTKYHILLTVLFFIALLCNSCKKYPKDEHYTLRTITNRITGTYILDKLYCEWHRFNLLNTALRSP